MPLPPSGTQEEAFQGEKAKGIGGVAIRYIQVLAYIPNNGMRSYNGRI